MRVGSLIGSTYSGWKLSGSQTGVDPQKIIFDFCSVRSFAILGQLFIIIFWGQVAFLVVNII